MANDPDRPAPGAIELARIVAPHLLAFGFPLYALAFLASAPHEGAGALYFMLLPAAHALADRFSPKLRRQPVPRVPAWPFDAILYALAAFQLLNMVLLARLFSTQHFWTVDGLVAILLVGATSGYSAIVVAHELIHRRARWQQQLGRLLMCTAMYEHFYTEHLRGHHVRVSTSADPATARYGESFLPFYLRTVPAQFVSAWRIEAHRLGCDDARPWDKRLLRSRVVHGLVVEWGIAFAILATCGTGAFGIYLLQALFASRALEVVNYFEHWGLARSGPRISTRDSWDTDSWVTYYSLTGLSRHADHHAFGARPYQELQLREESPRLPHGYLALFPLALARNARFQRLMTAELERRRLGPFAPGAEGVG
jgi:alkane 1-monooxygenase